MEGKPPRSSGGLERPKRDARGVKHPAEADLMDAHNAWPLHSFKRSKADSSDHDLHRRRYFADAVWLDSNDVGRIARYHGRRS